MPARPVSWTSKRSPQTTKIEGSQLGLLDVTQSFQLSHLVGAET